MFRSRSWFGSGGLWKPKNPHSLEHLKYLYNVLSKNQTVSENNRSLLVETLRSIAEILIWGDQNDSTVFDFFLEKNMLSFFLKIMKQKCGSYVCVQLLQTLNILFENIRNETSLYYLLSNNHVNSIIVHKFDFSDEEVMAYYISFLKTLSLKLNSHTIHFFYNEHTHDFPLYTEAIKFFNNSESMVRIAVRTLTLNVYRIHDKSMLKFIRDKTAAPYFSNLVWFIGNHVYELNGCIRDNAEHEVRIKLADIVAEHLDHLHYLNDILCLEIDDLNQVLTEHLLQRLFIPLYVTSLGKGAMDARSKTPKVSSILSLFLLSQVFLIMTHAPLVRLLANILINGNESIFQFKPEVTPPKLRLSSISTMEMDNSEESSSNLSNENITLEDTSGGINHKNDVESMQEDRISCSSAEATIDKLKAIEELYFQTNPNVTDLTQRIILSSIFESMDTTENDYAPLFTLCLLHALYDNSGIDAELLNTFFHGGIVNLDPEGERTSRRAYNDQLVDRLIAIICLGVKYESKVRVITLQLLSSLLLRLAIKDPPTSVLDDAHLALIEGAREENILLLQNYYKTDEMFLEVFEDEYLEMSAAKPLSIEHLMMDSNLLLPPVGSPLTGIAFDKRLPCGEVERSRRSIRVYFLLRKLSLTLRKESEKYLPLTNPQNCVHIDENLDLTNSDMLSCVVITRDNVRTRRFLVVDVFQLILVDPSNKQMGWGVVKFVGFLQDIEVLGDKDDSRCLHITVKTSPTNQRSSQSKTPLLAAKFLFDDQIRCMAAKQRLMKGKQKARQGKLHLIAKLLDLTGSSPSPQLNLRRPNRRPVSRSDRSMYTPISRTLPGVAKAVNSDALTTTSVPSAHGMVRRRSREASPSIVSRTGVIQEEEIPLGNIRNAVGRVAAVTQLTSRVINHGSMSTESLGNNIKSTQLISSSRNSNLSLDLGRRSPANQGVTGTTTTTTVIDQPHISTPHSETSFMTLTTTTTVAGNSDGTSPHLNSASARRKKGGIETV